MIEWKGLHANTPYSSANNKTQDDAVVGMQDTIYVTGPGYGGYEANVRVHNASGAVVALISVCGGGGALSAPAPVRILDDSTTYSYSLEVVRGVVPSDDPDKIVIRIIGGASKRYPGQASTLPDGSTSFAGPVNASGGIRIVQAGSKGMRIPFYRLANITNDALGYTYQTIISLEQHFDAIQLVIGTLQTSGTIRSAHYCNVIADENLTDAALNALSGWAFVDWAENDGNGVRAQFASFAATTSRPRLMLSEIKTFNSVNRTDGGAGALLVVRSHLYPDNLTPTLAGNGTTDAFANVARTDGRTMKIRRMVNNGMTTFTGGADASQTPLLGVIYYSRGKVVNVVKFGDSIMQGRNSPMGDGYVRPETIRRNNVDGVAWECSDCAWSGLTTGNYHNIAMDILDNASLPVDIAIYPGESPNNIASGASEATALAAVKANKFRLQQFLDKCRSKRVVPILSTFAPVATAVNNYTACDNVRRDYNDDTIRPYANRNTLIVDTDSVLAGANVGGQVQPLAGVMEDGIHPSTAGNELIRAKLQSTLNRVTVS